MSVVVYFLWFDFHGKIAKQNVTYDHNHFLPHQPPYFVWLTALWGGRPFSYGINKELQD
jgi:hypothetical protein